MREIELEFRYKGERNYVHGSDLYMKIVNEMNLLGYGNWDHLGLNIKQICHHNLTCFVSDKKKNHADEVVNFTLKKGRDRVFGTIVENPLKKIITRYSFNENDMFNYCYIDSEKESIVYNNPNNTFLTIEVILASAKFFLEREVDNTVKWYFRRITLFRPIEEIESKIISLKKVSQKNGFIGFDLFIGDKQFGDGYAASISPGVFLE